MSRVIVCGGRDFSDYTRVKRVLDDVNEFSGIDELVHGACPTGADNLAGKWAREAGVPVREYPADWDTYKRAAGPRRNAEMVKSGATLVVAFPGGRGTADMVRRAKAAGIAVCSYFAARIVAD